MFLVDIACSALSGIAPRHRESVMGRQAGPKLENVDHINEPAWVLIMGLWEPTVQLDVAAHARGDPI